MVLVVGADGWCRRLVSTIGVDGRRWPEGTAPGRDQARRRKVSGCVGSRSSGGDAAAASGTDDGGTERIGEVRHLLHLAPPFAVALHRVGSSCTHRRMDVQ